MKIKTSLLLLVVALCLAACKKDNYSLPPETQTGANTFGCLIDGKVWIPKGSDGYSGTNKTAYYQYIYPGPVGYVFHLSGTDYDNNPLLGLDIGIDSFKLSEGATIRLSSGLPGNGGATYWIGNDFSKRYITNGTSQGEIHFTKFDEVTRIASGTFWFDAINTNGEIIHVTEGRFDVKFTR